MKRIVFAYLGISLFAVAPILVAITSSYAARAFGCQVDEGSNHPCMILGLDWGSFFYFLFVAGWFFILTVPLSAVLFVGLTIFLVVRRIRRRSIPS
jgi:hypothetical protein